MEGINTQFFGVMEIARWITEAFSNSDFKLLINRYTGLETPSRPITFWIIGPKQDIPNTLFMYGHTSTGGSVERVITSINPKGPTTWHVRDLLGAWWELKHEDAASSTAKKMDMLIHGAYTEVALVSADVMLEMIE